MSKYKYATIDIETTGLNRFKHDITWIGIGLYESLEDNEGKIYLLNMSKQEDIDKFFRICERLRKYKLKLIWQGGKFDTLFIELKYNLKLPISDDTMLMGTAYDMAGDHSLKPMAKLYLGVPDWDIPKKEKTNPNSDKIKPYLRFDVNHTWGLFQFFNEMMTDLHWKIYKKLLKPAYLMYRKVERTGICFDRKRYKEVKIQFADEEKKRLKTLTNMYDINWNSPQQKQKVLYEEEQLPILKRSQKTGKPSADTKTLKRLAFKGHELPIKIMEYSEINTLNKMFLYRWGDDSKYDGRIHPNFGLTNVRTGRTSCSEPNLQQVPRNKTLRSLFTPTDPDKIFFEADYSQLELRIGAHFAKDPVMLDIYRKDGDIHTETARGLTGGKEPTKDERGKAKAVNFGFLYGMSAGGFVSYAFDSYNQLFTKPEADKYRTMFFTKYPRLLAWHKEQEELCEIQGGVYDLFGRFRKLPDIYSHDNSLRSAAIRRAINTPVQGTGSNILLGSAVEIDKELSPYGLDIEGTIHDAIVGEFYKKDLDWIVPEIKRIMSHPKIMDEFDINLSVKLDTDVGVGPWGTH